MIQSKLKEISFEGGILLICGINEPWSLLANICVTFVTIWHSVCIVSVVWCWNNKAFSSFVQSLYREHCELHTTASMFEDFIGWYYISSIPMYGWFWILNPDPFTRSRVPGKPQQSLKVYRNKLYTFPKNSSLQELQRLNLLYLLTCIMNYLLV